MQAILYVVLLTLFLAAVSYLIVRASLVIRRSKFLPSHPIAGDFLVLATCVIISIVWLSFLSHVAAPVFPS